MRLNTILISFCLAWRLSSKIGTLSLEDVLFTKYQIFYRFYVVVILFASFHLFLFLVDICVPGEVADITGIVKLSSREDRKFWIPASSATCKLRFSTLLDVQCLWECRTSSLCFSSCNPFARPFCCFLFPKLQFLWLVNSVIFYGEIQWHCITL